MQSANICELADGPAYAEKLTAFDVETLYIKKGMQAFPIWCHKDVWSPTWQYGSVSVVGYDPERFMASIKATLFNSKEHIDGALDGTIQNLEHQGHAVFR